LNSHAARHTGAEDPSAVTLTLGPHHTGVEDPTEVTLTLGPNAVVVIFIAGPPVMILAVVICASFALLVLSRALKHCECCDGTECRVISGLLVLSRALMHCECCDGTECRKGELIGDL